MLDTGHHVYPATITITTDNGPFKKEYSNDLPTGPRADELAERTHGAVIAQMQEQLG